MENDNDNDSNNSNEENNTVHLSLVCKSNKGTRIVNLPIKRSFERDQPTTLCCALTTLCFRGGGVGGIKCSILNMNAMLCSHYSIHVYYALLSLYSIHVYYALLSLYSIHVYYALLSLYSIHVYYALLSLYSIHVYYALLSLYSIHVYYAMLYPPPPPTA